MPDGDESGGLGLDSLLAGKAKIVAIIVVCLVGGNAHLLKPSENTEVLEKMEALSTKLKTVSETVEIIKIEQKLAKQTGQENSRDIKVIESDVKSLLRTPFNRPP